MHANGVVASFHVRGRGVKMHAHYASLRSATAQITRRKRLESFKRTSE